MKTFVKNLVAAFAFAGMAFIFGTAGGFITARQVLIVAAGEPARAKVTFPREHQIEVVVPSVVRGKRVNCLIYADVKRRISSISC